MAENGPPEKGAVEGLKSKLYSRANKGEMHDVRTPLSPSDSHAKVAWEEAPPPEVPPALQWDGEEETKSISLASTFFIGSMIFFVGALGTAAYLFFGGANLISPQNIELQVVAPSLIDGGSEAQFQIIVENRNPSELLLADLIVTYPPGARDPKDPSKELVRDRQSIGNIASGQQLKRTSSAVFYGEEGATQTVRVTLEYTVKNSNAVFVKETSTEVTIGSSPVSLRVETPTEAIAGQPFAIEVTVRSNATVPLQDVVIEGQYPFGYSVISATPRADGRQTLWRLGTLLPGTSETITLRGTIDGSDGDERVFRFLAGSEADTTSARIQVPYLSVPQTLTVRRPFISGSIAIDGKTGASVAVAAGKPLISTVSWQNNLSEAVTDVEAELVFDGPMLDPNSVAAGNGFYQSATKTIIWTKAQDPSLAYVPPGGKGALQFSFATLVPGVGGTVYTNPTVGLRLQVRGVRAGQDGAPAEIISAASINATVASALALTARSGYVSGPLPPRAEDQTTYRVIWSVKNSSNTVGNATISSVLPPYVEFVSSGSGITYDAGSRTVRWSLGDLKAGVGYNSAELQNAFELRLTPSATQVGQSPPLTGGALLQGTDRFAGVAVETSAPAVTTRTADEDFEEGMDIVVPKQ